MWQGVATHNSFFIEMEKKMIYMTWQEVMTHNFHFIEME